MNQIIIQTQLSSVIMIKKVIQFLKELWELIFKGETHF